MGIELPDMINQKRQNCMRQNKVMANSRFGYQTNMTKLNLRLNQISITNYCAWQHM